MRAAPPTHLAGNPAIRRIAVLRALQLGDLLVAVPALRSLRAGFPAAEITLIGLPWAEWFARRYGHYVDRFVAFGGYPGIGEVEVVPQRVERFLTAQRAYSYDLVIQLHGSGQTSNPAALALGGRLTAGYCQGSPPAGLAVAAEYPADKPEVLRNLELMLRLGCPDLGTRLEFPLQPEDVAEADRLLPGQERTGERLVGLHPGSRPPARRWPVERFAAVGDQLARAANARIVLTGGPGEEAIARAVAERMTTPAVNLAGRTSLGGLGALIARLDLFIGNDTGPAHVARAVDTPSVTVFGPADVRRWAPLEDERARHRVVRQPVPCSPCGHWECPIDHRCLRWIEPKQVIAAAGALLPGGVAA